jgi:hypothetical protein
MKTQWELLCNMPLKTDVLVWDFEAKSQYVTRLEYEHKRAVFGLVISHWQHLPEPPKT